MRFYCLFQVRNLHEAYVCLMWYFDGASFYDSVCDHPSGLTLELSKIWALKICKCIWSSFKRNVFTKKKSFKVRETSGGVSSTFLN